MTALQEISVRAALPSDAEFVFTLTEACMRHYAEATWGKWDAETTRRSFFPETHSIVRLCETDIGCMELIEEPSIFRLNKLYIAPLYQNRGIGTEILRIMISNARAARKPICLSVLRVNPAKALYRRLGFKVQSQTPERVYMEFNSENSN
jgi:GNAT superfamily N-acetyltransferase